MLSEWLRNSQKSTWEDLIAALRSPIVGLQSLASELENKLGRVSGLSTLILSLSISLPPATCFVTGQCNVVSNYIILIKFQQVLYDDSTPANNLTLYTIKDSGLCMS